MITIENANIFQDGDKWCALLGENIMDGVSGWGDTPEEALDDLRKQLEKIEC